jgi:CheY-like chemotaxis protein
MAGPARILVVEDDTTMREMLHTYLARDGYEVTEAYNGDVALPILRGDEPFDLLLTDVVMPGEHDGFGLSAEARRLRPGLKVLHVTGVSERLKENLPLVQQGTLMQKPVDRHELLKRVGHALGSWAVNQNETLRRAYAYWLGKANGRRLPERTDLDPADIKYLLPDLLIFESIGERPRYRCRLVGTRVVEAMGLNPMNRFIDEIFEEKDVALLEWLLGAVNSKSEPAYAASSFRSDEQAICIERLLLPFAVNGTDAHQIVVVQTCDWARRVGTLHDLARTSMQRTDAVQWPRG